MLELYYDMAMKDKFEELFGRFYIGSHPTPERNSYLILKFNFAMVNPEPEVLEQSFEPEPEVLEQSFEEHTSACFDIFNAKYGHLLGEGYLEGYAQKPNAESRLEYICNCCKLADQSVYLIIDEYDNFTNVVLSRYGHDRYHALTHGAGFFRFFFKKNQGGDDGGWSSGETDVHLWGVSGDFG